jgi:Tat protein secretion system quality control protein TatD with DNase activity
VGFVVHKVALGQVFSEYFGFPCQSSFQQLLHSHPHLSSGAGTICQKWLQNKGLSPSPPALKKRKPTEALETLPSQSIKLVLHYFTADIKHILLSTAMATQLYISFPFESIDSKHDLQNAAPRIHKFVSCF